ncbi:LysR family transcriptional regulator [Novosphingobium arvoryzae]|uniref:Transcriptional regulator n=1 Tax=Novosphingobium arvoryzae TaxID=1256514 RepID=A0A918RNI1_9SPHN|nr:LysR family transcriptional regulator [Novosphingobium arvoryzae]GHA05174.1 transcriptional regulator [Novosphingobium arvoryzae]
MQLAHDAVMNLKHLRHAVGLADFGSFTAAADRLAISQPALSRSIQALEHSLGLTLFIREPGRIVLTEAGQDVISQARMVLRQASNLEQAARQLASGEAGRVRIGLGPMFSRLAEPLLVECWKPGQEVDLQIHILPVERLVSGLLAGEIDFFVADGRAAAGQPAIQIDRIGKARTGYFVRSGHPLAGCADLLVEDLRPFVRATPNLPRTRLDSDDAIRASTDAQTGRLACENLDLLIRFAISSDAVLLAIEGAIAEELQRGQLVALNLPELQDWHAQIGLASLAGRDWSALSIRYTKALRKLLDRSWLQN